MSTQEELNQAAKAAMKELQAKARAEHGSNTQPLLVVYAVESFLRRLAISQYARQMVLKGGMLMAANDIRRMTRDADLSTHGVSNNAEHVCQVIAEIAALDPSPHDGIVINPESIKAEVMRAVAEYQGVRCKLVAKLANARIPFALDLSFGDPGQATEIELESVVDRPAVPLQAYPLALNLAEKIVTAMQRREVSTRDRDFADLWVTSRRHRLDAGELRRHIKTVAHHRGQPIISLGEALANMPDRQQSYTAMVARMLYLSPPPGRWTDQIADVVEFADPLIADDYNTLSYWDPEQLSWIPRTRRLAHSGFPDLAT